MEFAENTYKIYSLLQDDMSKEIFEKRLMYSLTGDYNYILKMVQMTEEGVKIRDLLDNDKKKVIFGAGIWGGTIIKAYRNINFECFVDNKKVDDNEEEYFGIPLISFAKFKKEFSDALVLISSRLYYNEMYNQLISAGVKEYNIVNAGSILDEMAQRQYFDLPWLKSVGEDEVFVDCGCFDGKTTELFAKWCDYKFKHIYAFEPDKSNELKCLSRFEKIFDREKYEIIPKGCWNKEETLRFNSIANGSSTICDEGETIIEVTSVDSAISEDVTFIKMDIEGSEYEAIEGARNMIKKCKPKLAISVYHKPEDIWKLPMLIHEICPEYKFYLRHYSIAAFETVLYAL